MRYRSRVLHLLPLAFLAPVSQCSHVSTSPRALAGDQVGAVESRWENGHVFIKLWAGDKPVWMLLDSGASNTLVRSSVLADLAARPVGETLFDAAADRSAVRAYSGATLAATSVDIPVPTLYELPAGSPALEGVRRVDGIAGFELFAQTRVELDPRRHLVRILPPSDSVTGRSAGRDDVSFELDHRVPIVVADLRFADGTTLRARFIFDLGSNADVQIASSFARANHLDERITDTVESSQSSLLRDQRGIEGHAAALTIGHGVVPNPAVFIVSDSVASFSRAHVAGTIGLGVLQHFVIGMDYAAERITLRSIDVAARPDSTDPICALANARQPVVAIGRRPGSPSVPVGNHLPPGCPKQ